MINDYSLTEWYGHPPRWNFLNLAFLVENKLNGQKNGTPIDLNIKIKAILPLVWVQILPPIRSNGSNTKKSV